MRHLTVAFSETWPKLNAFKSWVAELLPGSVKSSAGTHTASFAVTDTPATEAICACSAATSVASVG